MTRYYYFLVALLISYQIERRQLARSIDVALCKSNKNKATSLRIRSRTACTRCQGIFFFHSLSNGRVLSRNGSKLPESQVAAVAVASREDTIDTCTSKSVPAILITNFTTCSNGEVYLRNITFRM